MIQFQDDVAITHLNFSPEYEKASRFTRFARRCWLDSQMSLNLFFSSAATGLNAVSDKNVNASKTSHDMIKHPFAGMQNNDSNQDHAAVPVTVAAYNICNYWALAERICHGPSRQGWQRVPQASQSMPDCKKLLSILRSVAALTQNLPSSSQRS